MTVGPHPRQAPTVRVAGINPDERQRRVLAYHKIGGRSIDTQPVSARLSECYLPMRSDTLGKLMVVADHQGAAPNPEHPYRKITCEGAKWQIMRGSHDWPACHTAPGLLRVDGTPLPMLIDDQFARLMAVIQFSRCMLMPKAVNSADAVVDRLISGPALEAAATTLLTHPEADARDGMRLYFQVAQQCMSDLGIGSAADLLGEMPDPLTSGVDAAIVRAAAEAHWQTLDSALVPEHAMRAFAETIDKGKAKA